jgi:O-antigen ligase
MSTVIQTRPLSTAAGVLTGSFVAAGLLVYAATSESNKIVGGMIAAAVALGAAFASGNIRLYSLWGLMFSLPFDLSKRFGQIIEKMGGESSFRIEMSDPFLIVLAFFLFRDIYSYRRPGLKIPKLTYAWIAIMVMGVYAALFGRYHLTAAHEVFRMFKVMVLFLVITNELERPQRLLQCTGALALAVMLQSGVGLVQYATHKHFGLDLLGETAAGTLDQLAVDSVRTEKAFRVGAFMQHPNIFGAFLAVLLPVLIAVFLIQLGKGWRVFFLFCAGLGMASLIATLSRSGWVSFALAGALLMFLMIMHKGLRRRSLLAAGVAMAALGIVALYFSGPIMDRVFESKENAMLSRSEYSATALGMIKERPILGWGLNSYVFVAPPFTKYGAKEAREKYKNWLPPVHNIYLLWMAETGTVGLLLHLTIVGALLWTAIRNLRVRDELLFSINAGCLAGTIAFLVDGLFSFTLRINSMLRLFWVIAGIIMAIHYWRLRDIGFGKRTGYVLKCPGAPCE